ncbi:MAG: glycoside hydrolase family 65 protein [Candidatus Methylomirabilales bacterium]
MIGNRVTGDIFRVENDPRWLVTIEGWTPKHEPAVESLCALVNGYCGVRAAVEEGSSVSNPATFLNGVFDAAHDMVAQSAATPEHQVIAAPTPELVKGPDWSRIRVMLEGVPLQVVEDHLLHHKRILDMRRGVLVREWRVRHGTRTTSLRSLRFASLDDRHLLGQVLEITPEDWSGQIVLEMLVEDDVTNEGGVRHLIGLQTHRDSDRLLLTAVTSEKGIAICLGAWARLTTGHGTQMDGVQECTQQALIHRWVFQAERGQSYTCHKLCALFTSRDSPKPAERVSKELDRAVVQGFPAILTASTRSWGLRWASTDIRIDGDDIIQHQTRFALYHLIGCANPADEYASPGARSLTGERYKGHVFWDTEIFVLPFFIFTHPPTARALLMYRYHTLPAARNKAHSLGYRGALYAWESTDTGVDVTPSFVINAAGERLEILTGLQEHHISADIGYAIWQYWKATDDTAFFVHAGAEMLCEIARFWASRVVQREDGCFHIEAAIGPDEYHETVTDNAYTNCMARWVLRRAVDAAGWLRIHHAEQWVALSEKIGLADEEIDRWSHVAEKLVDNCDPHTGLFEQYRGYFDLVPVDLGDYEPREQTMDVILGWQELVRTQIIKQADVVMLLVLLGHHYSRSVWEANYRFYEPRTSHDSSLSASMHALMAARLGDLNDAERYFRKAASIDLDFEHGVTAAGGVHIAALGGMWQALVFGFGGLMVTDQGPTFAPHVPKGWGPLRIPLRWRGEQLYHDVHA